MFYFCVKSLWSNYTFKILFFNYTLADREQEPYDNKFNDRDRDRERGNKALSI